MEKTHFCPQPTNQPTKHNNSSFFEGNEIPFSDKIHSSICTLPPEATATPLVAMQFPEAKKPGKRRNEEPRRPWFGLEGVEDVEHGRAKMLVMNRGVLQD